jgi:hypothetical protein
MVVKILCMRKKIAARTADKRYKIWGETGVLSHTNMIFMCLVVYLFLRYN